MFFTVSHFQGAVKTTYAFSAFLTPFLSNFRFAWYQQAGEGGCYDTLAERYGECIRCFTLTPHFHPSLSFTGNAKEPTLLHSVSPIKWQLFIFPVTGSDRIRFLFFIGKKIFEGQTRELSLKGKAQYN